MISDRVIKKILSLDRIRTIIYGKDIEDDRWSRSYQSILRFGKIHGAPKIADALEMIQRDSRNGPIKIVHQYETHCFTILQFRRTAAQ